MTEGPLCFADSSTYLPRTGGISSGVGYLNDLRERHDQFFDFIAPRTISSTARYFIPPPEPGQTLVSARFRSFLVLIGDPSAVTINGHRPEIDTPFDCSFGDPPVCIGGASWDLTADAVAQIGGELPVTFDPNPPGFDGIRGFEHDRFDGYGLNLSVNYPWTILDTRGVLELTYQQTCPKQLNVMLTPNRPAGLQQMPSVLPSLPGRNTVTDAVRNAATMATVDAIVTSCPPQGGTPPPSVTVQFSVQAPTASDEAGGHTGPHSGPRPKGTLDTPSCVVTRFDSQGMGSCDVPVTYRPSEVSGVETILAQATDFPNATAKVRVEVPGLVNLAAFQTTFFFLTGQTPEHPDPDNHWGTTGTVTNIQRVALDFLQFSCETLRACATLGINDMSLHLGGVFDICGTWHPENTCPRARMGGHFSHHTGTSVDIEQTACLDPNLRGQCLARPSVSSRFIRRACLANGQGRLNEDELPKLHCEFPR